MGTQHLLDAQTADDAREFAIDWQNWQAEQSLSYGELAEWASIFTLVGEKFNITAELQKNGII